MEKISYSEMCEKLREFNSQNNVTSKGVGPCISGVVVFTSDSFTKEYSETERSYRVSNQNKAFIANNCSNSVFADCFDGLDTGVRIDLYMYAEKNPWKVDYCYMEEE